MAVTNIIANGYDNFTDFNTTNDYNNIVNCTDNENNIGIIIPTSLLTVPCGLSFLCLLSLMIYILIKPLITNKGDWRYFFISISSC